MTKQIKVSDETYERLQFLSKEAYRTLGGEIDYLIDYFGGYTESIPGKNISLPTAKKESSEKGVPPIISRGDFPDRVVKLDRATEIVNEIRELEAEVALADTDNQDPDYWEVINAKKSQVQLLWNEWHKVTGK